MIYRKSQQHSSTKELFFKLMWYDNFDYTPNGNFSESLIRIQNNWSVNKYRTNDFTEKFIWMEIGEPSKYLHLHCKKNMNRNRLIAQTKMKMPLFSFDSNIKVFIFQWIFIRWQMHIVFCLKNLRRRCKRKHYINASFILIRFTNMTRPMYVFHAKWLSESLKNKKIISLGN